VTHPASPSRGVRDLVIDAAPLLLLLLAAAGLRFVVLGSRELFRDEAASWMLAQAAWTDIVPRSAAEPYAPVYPFVLKGWMSLLGDSPAALRSLSAVFGIAIVAASWAWAHAALGARVAVLAGALVVLSPLAIANARDVRMYAMETLWITLAWWLIWRLLVNRPGAGRQRLAIGLAAASIGAELWTLPIGVGAYLLQATVVAGVLVHGPRSGVWPALLALLAGMLVFLLGLPRLLADAGGTPFWTPKPNLGDLPETFGVAFGWQQPSIAWLALVPLAVLAMVGLWTLFRRGADELPTALCVSGAAGLIVLWWLLSQWRPAYDARYLGSAIPPLAIAIGFGWQWVVGWIEDIASGLRLAIHAAGVALLGLVAVGAGVFITSWVHGTDVPPVDAVVRTLQRAVRPGDVVLVADARSYLPVAYLTGRHVAPIVLAGPVRYWRSGREPAFSGGDLVPPELTLGPNDPLVAGELPGLSATGSIWLVAATDPAVEVDGFLPLQDGRLLEAERFQVVGNGASALVVLLVPPP
jgi:hypothetical protein